MVKSKSIPLCIILSLVTCGIYGLIWLYSLTEDTNAVSGENSTVPSTAVLLSIVTCGIYGYFWAYKMGKNIGIAKQSRGQAPDDKSTLFLLLAIFGLQIVNYCILQSELNLLESK